MKRAHLGEFEELTLLAVRALGDAAHAVGVQSFLERRGGRTVSMGAVYAALIRLDTKGLLRSTWGDATPAPGGKRKRLYRLTPAGARAIRDARLVRERIWRLIEDGDA